MSVRTCVVNLNPSDGVPAVRLNQYDTGVTLLFTVMDGESPADFDSGTTVTIQGTRPSGTGYSLAATLDGNFVTVDSTIEMTREYGDSVCELRFAKNGVDVGTGNFKIGVEKAAFANDTIDENVNHWNQLAQQVHADTITATDAALAAGNAVSGAQSAATSAADSADRAFTYAKVAQDAKDDIHEYISDAEAWATGTRNGEDVPSTDEAYENNAKYYTERAAEHVTTAGERADAAEGSAQDSEAYAIGTRGGVAVGSEDPAYHNNAKYWAENGGGANIASLFDANKAYTAGDYVLYNNYMYRFTVDHAAGAWDASHVTAVKVGDELTDIKGDLNDMNKVEIGGFVYGYYIAIRDPQVIDIANPVEDYRYKYAVVDCKPGDVFFISGYGGDSPRVYCFVSSNNTKLSYSNANENLSNRRVVAPANAAKVIIQDRATDSSQDGKGLPSYKVMDTFGAVRFDIAQDKTEEEKAVARENIGVNIDDISGLSYETKLALLSCFSKVAWTDEYGRDYYNELADALDIDPSFTLEYGVYIPRSVVNGKYIDNDGIVKTGNTNQSFYIEDYIPVIRKDYWIGYQPPVLVKDEYNQRIYSGSNWRVSEYDIDKQFIKQTQYEGSQPNGEKSSAIITFSNSTKYIRLGFYDANNSSSSPNHVFDIESPARITTLPMELGDIDVSTGQNKTDVRRIRTAGYIPMTGSITVSGYPFGSQMVAIGIRCYDSNKNYLGTVSGFPTTDTTKQLLANTAYVRMIMQIGGHNMSEFAKCVGYLYSVNGIRYLLT